LKKTERLDPSVVFQIARVALSHPQDDLEMMIKTRSYWILRTQAKKLSVLHEGKDMMK
jgi:hypothetical protein